MDKRDMQKEQREEVGEETNIFFQRLFLPCWLMEKQINRINLSVSLRMSLKAIISNHKEEKFKEVSCNAEARSPPVC